MSDAARPPCPGCPRLQVQLAEHRAALDRLTATVTRLQEQLTAARKTSATSSRPPSSDIVKPPPPPPPPGQVQRTRGGQPGHPMHDRPPFSPQQVTHAEEHLLHGCPGCGGALRRNGGLARVVQQVDFQPPCLTVQEHTCPAYWCAHCERGYTAALPEPIAKGGLVGPRLTALIAYLKGFCHASFTTVRKFLRDVVQVSISRGQLSKILGKVRTALDAPYQELLDALPGQAVLNVDETGHKDSGQRMWTWCFRASLYTLFKIDPTRSGDVLIAVLGREFNGVLGCDCFSAYRRYMREFGVTLQFCLAHLIRDVKFLMTLPGRQERAYGTRLRDALRALFRVIHQRDQMPAPVFQARLTAAREDVLAAGQDDVPGSGPARALARRLQTHGRSYFTFVTTPGVAPTNNLAEQAIRFVVIDRHITQGTRGEAGQGWCERIWTVIATCEQHGRSVFDYLHEAVQAYFRGTSAPSLLPGA